MSFLNNYHWKFWKKAIFGNLWEKNGIFLAIFEEKWQLSGIFFTFKNGNLRRVSFKDHGACKDHGAFVAKSCPYNIWQGTTLTSDVLQGPWCLCRQKLSLQDMTRYYSSITRPARTMVYLSQKVVLTRCASLQDVPRY